MKIKFYADPGHGWAAVKLDVLDKLGIADKISSYSYVNGKTVYLEEDCDLGILLNSLEANGISVEFDEKHTNKYSHIRNYDRYII